MHHFYSGTCLRWSLCKAATSLKHACINNASLLCSEPLLVYSFIIQLYTYVWTFYCLAMCTICTSATLDLLGPIAPPSVGSGALAPVLHAGAGKASFNTVQPFTLSHVGSMCTYSTSSCMEPFGLYVHDLQKY